MKNNSSGDNQRHYKRYDVDLPAKVGVLDREKEIKLLNFNIVDIAAEGLFLRTDNPFAVGTKLRMELELPLDELETEAESARIHVKGIVVRLAEDGMAVKFTIDRIECDRPVDLIIDVQAQLDWHHGLEKDVNWFDAKKWAEQLIAQGSGWHLPELEQLRDLYAPSSANKYKIDRVFHLSAGMVWSSEKNESLLIACVDFETGDVKWIEPSKAANMRAIAVRSRADTGVVCEGASTGGGDYI